MRAPKPLFIVFILQAFCLLGFQVTASNALQLDAPDSLPYLNSYLHVDTIVEIAGLTDVYKPQYELKTCVSETDGMYYIMRSQEVLNRDSLLLYGVDLKSKKIKTEILEIRKELLPRLDKRATANIRALAVRKHYVALYIFKHILLFEKQEHRYILKGSAKAVSISNTYPIFEFVNDSILFYGGMIHPKVRFECLNVHTLKRRSFPLEEKLLNTSLKYFSPNKFMDVHNGQILYSQTDHYRLYCTDVAGNVCDTLEINNADWHSIPPARQKHINNLQPGMDVITYYERQMKQPFDRMFFVSYFGANKLLIGYTKNFSARGDGTDLFDIWERHDGHFVKVHGGLHLKPVSAFNEEVLSADNFFLSMRMYNQGPLNLADHSIIVPQSVAPFEPFGLTYEAYKQQNRALMPANGTIVKLIFYTFTDQ